MAIAQIVYDICELSKSTKKPFLLMSNPGGGKTTGVVQYAEKNGYHLEIVIGSRSTPEELLGYQVNNGGESLEHLDSQWWHRIIEFHKKGIPSILFADEISTCPGQTEGAMLSLIQDRKNQKGEYLPDDCIVIAAANYSKNLPSYMDIITPAINRFCVINLTEGMTGVDLVNELFHPEEAKPRKFVPFTKKDDEEYTLTMEKFFTNIFTSYNDKKSAKGFIDINNTDIAGLYQESESSLYNVISLRSMSDFTKLLKCAIEYGMNDKSFLSKIVDGMIGAGSNSFKNYEQASAYRDLLHVSVDQISKKFMRHTPVTRSKKSKFDYGESVADIVTKLNQRTNELSESFVQDSESSNVLDELVQALSKNYGNIGQVVFGMNDNKEKQATFLSDYEAVGDYFDNNEEDIRNNFSDSSYKIVGFLQGYSAYYNQLAKNKIYSDVNKMRVFKNYKSSLYVTSMLAINKFFNEELPVEVTDEMLKKETVITVGVRRIEAKTLYKIPYGSSVCSNQLGIPVTEYYPIVFEKGKLVTIVPEVLKDND